MNGATPVTGGRPLLLGHRGARRYSPENTLAAFELALAHGCDGFEFDVRCTADTQPVICHDATLAGRNVASCEYQQLAASCPPERPLARLEEVLRVFSGRAVLDIELKVAGVESLVVELLRRYRPARQYFVSSFIPEVIGSLHRIAPDLPLGLICENRRQLEAWTDLRVQSLFLKSGLATENVVRELQAAEKKVFVWTVNRESEMRRFAQLGADGIISDDAELLARTLGA